MNDNPEEKVPSDRIIKRKKKTRGAKVAIVAVVAILAASTIALLLWLLIPRGGGGQPVPAPRNAGSPESANQGSTARGELTLSIDPEQAQRAAIKIELVGERPASESSVQPITGVIQANAYRETPVMSLVGGIVRTVGPELGQNVRKGQTVAVVFSNELAEAQSKYLAALAELEEHHKHHARTEKLVQIGAASREELESATSKLKTAESEVANLRQRLLLLGLSSPRVNALRSTSQIASEVNVPSPSSGTVTNRTVNPGEVIDANKELLRVTDLSSVWVVAQVYEKDLGRIHVGSSANITTDAYPGRVFRGQVSYVDPKVDPPTRTAQARIELANPGQQLKIGMFVNVAFAGIAGPAATTPIIPTTAAQNIGSQQVVFVATNEPNVFAARAVRLGLESNGYFPVLEGLSVGDRVVTDGSFMLRAEWLKTHPNMHSH